MYRLKFASHVFKFCRTGSWLAKRNSSKMSNNAVLIQKFNPGTGTLEWDLQAENYDYTQEIARAGFADMLHDEERALSALRQDGKATRVLDIGTGTGLLSIMAAKHHATSVTACETFQPMAKCAREVIAQNGCDDVIKLIPKRSTDIVVGVNKDMEDKANVLITEVFDTELIGEGAIGTFNHAHKSLLTEDSIVVPARATIFVQLIESELVSSWNRSKPIKYQDKLIKPPSDVFTCAGNGAVHDIQLAQLSPANFKVLSDPIPLFHFDWNSKEPIPNDEVKTVKMIATSSGKAQAMFMWWSLDMDREGEIILSCAPPWAHPEGNNLPWRDHWMQAVYYFPNDISIKYEGEQLHLTGYHDEYSLWFGLQTDPLATADLSRPFCDCSVHLAVSRTRLGQLNDEERNSKYFKALQKVVDSDTVCMTLGDGCLLGLIVAKLGAKKIYAVERNPHCRRVLDAWIKENGLQEQITVLNGNLDNKMLELKVNLVLGEPVFESSVLPWHNLYFARWKNSVQHLLVDGVAKILPGKAHIYAMAIEMKDLWKIRAPVHSTQEINLSVFDKLIENAIDSSDAQVEPHPLWEYPSRALSTAVQIMTVDLTTLSREKNEILKVNGTINIPVAGKLNGIALWVDWHLDENTTISGGPVTPVTLNQNVRWDAHSKQAVYFLKKPINLFDNGGKVLHYETSLALETYELKLHYSVK